MKKNRIFKSLLCLLTIMSLVIGTAATASAAITFKNVTANRSGYVSMGMNTSAGEKKFIFEFWNDKTGRKITSKTTTANPYVLPIAKNMWYRLNIKGYDLYNRLKSQRPGYICNNPTGDMKAVLTSSYGTTIRMTWPSTWGSTGYYVYRSTNNGKTWSCVSKQKGTSYTVTQPKYATYSYYVRPYKTVGSKTYVGPVPTYYQQYRVY